MERTLADAEGGSHLADGVRVSTRGSTEPPGAGVERTALSYELRDE
jgi:hypothetical protein